MKKYYLLGQLTNSTVDGGDTTKKWVYLIYPKKSGERLEFAAIFAYGQDYKRFFPPRLSEIDPLPLEIWKEWLLDNSATWESLRNMFFTTYFTTSHQAMAKVLLSHKVYEYTRRLFYGKIEEIGTLKLLTPDELRVELIKMRLQTSV